VEHKEQAYSHCRVSDQPGDLGAARFAPYRRSPLTFSFVMPLMLAGLLVSTPVFADESPTESRSTAAQVWGYAQGITNNITRGVASWFGRGEDTKALPSEPRHSEPDTASATLNTDMIREAFPALTLSRATDDTLGIFDGGQEIGSTEFGFNSGQVPRERDLSASYVWESPRFGQFILSTNTGYQSRRVDRLLESSPVLPRNNESSAAAFVSNVTNIAPELQSSFTFTWQIGNHTATAVTTYADAMDAFSGLPAGQINMEQLNELVGQIATLDLRYGYSVATGRQSSASISVGVRNMFDRRPLSAGTVGVSNRLSEPSRVAYGTIKYQF